MPKVDNEVPEQLRPFLFHKLELSWGESKEANGDCPFCSKEKRFYVNTETGLWNCRVCGTNGNAISFLRKLYEESLEGQSNYEELAVERRIKADTIRKWGLVQSLVDNEWMAPTFTKVGAEIKLSNLYRYSPVGGKRRLIGTSNFSHGLFGLHLFDPTKPCIHLVEGPWDGMAWEDALGSKLSRREMLKTTNLLAVPGCETFKDEWITLFTGKEVIIFFDNDHPKPNRKGVLQEPHAYKGCKKVAKLLSNVTDSIKVLQWGVEGYDPILPSGCDLRDILTNTNGLNTILA